MRIELRKKIVEENKYYRLLAANPQFRLQGYDFKSRKFVVGIIKGNPKDYKPFHHLTFKYFDSWKEAHELLHGGMNNGYN